MVGNEIYGVTIGVRDKGKNVFGGQDSQELFGEDWGKVVSDSLNLIKQYGSAATYEDHTAEPEEWQDWEDGYDLGERNRRKIKRGTANEAVNKLFDYIMEQVENLLTEKVKKGSGR